MDELKSSGKPFDISKREVWEAWEKVKADKGAPEWTVARSRTSEPMLKHDLTAGTVQAHEFGKDATVGEVVFAPAAPTPPRMTAT